MHVRKRPKIHIVYVNSVNITKYIRFHWAAGESFIFYFWFLRFVILVFCGEPESLPTLHVTNFLDLCTLSFYKYSSHPPISTHTQDNQNTRRFYSILSVICVNCYYRPISVFVAMSLLTDLINLNLSETTDKIIAEYIWFVFFLHKNRCRLCIRSYALSCWP